MWLIGTDGSRGAAHAAKWAAAQAPGRVDRIRVTSIWSLPVAPAVPPVGPMTKYWDTETFAAAATADADALADELRGILGDAVEIDTLVEEGQASAHLIGESHDADLLVVGSRGRGGFARLVLGSTSTQCANHAEVPTAVVRESAEIAPATRLLVSFDGSTNSIDALRWAVRFATPGSTVDVVEVWEPVVIPMGADEMVFVDAVDRTRTRFEEQTAEILGADDLDARGVEVACHFVEGRTRHALAEWAEGADLVVMGARSGGAFGAALLGSVSGWLLHNVDRPMVVVPHHDGPTGTDAGSD